MRLRKPQYYFPVSRCFPSARADGDALDTQPRYIYIIMSEGDSRAGNSPGVIIGSSQLLSRCATCDTLFSMLFRLIERVKNVGSSTRKIASPTRDRLEKTRPVRSFHYSFQVPRRESISFPRSRFCTDAPLFHAFEFCFFFYKSNLQRKLRYEIVSATRERRDVNWRI